MGALGFLLMAPWLLVLCFLYWRFPQALPRTATRRVFDTLVMVAALVAAVFATVVIQLDWQPMPTDAIGRRAGDIWPQVLAVIYAYGTFTLVMFLGFVVRQLVWRRDQASQPKAG